MKTDKMLLIFPKRTGESFVRIVKTPNSALVLTMLGLICSLRVLFELDCVRR